LGADRGHARGRLLDGLTEIAMKLLGVLRLRIDALHRLGGRLDPVPHGAPRSALDRGDPVVGSPAAV
jgi:hypothetical protein